jgi:hypothetical protein
MIIYTYLPVSAAAKGADSGYAAEEVCVLDTTGPDKGLTVAKERLMNVVTRAIF